MAFRAVAWHISRRQQVAANIWNTNVGLEDEDGKLAPATDAVSGPKGEERELARETETFL